MICYNVLTVPTTRKYFRPPISSPPRELLTEKFHALLDECDHVADHALFGQTFDELENFFLIQGRTFLREVLQEKLQERIEQTEANASPQRTDCKKTGKQNTKAKTLAATHGHLTLHRHYCRCSGCKQYSFPVDVTLDIEMGYADRPERLATNPDSKEE